MNCIWILLLLFCSGNNGRGNNWSCGNNGCSNNWGCGNNSCRRNNMSNCCSNDNSRRQCNDRETVCEEVCEAACETACESAREERGQECGCRRNFAFTSFPVLDNCD